MVEDAAGLQQVNTEVLPKTVIPILKTQSIEDLAESIIFAKNLAAGRTKELAEGMTDSFPPIQGLEDEATRMKQIEEYFAGVVELTTMNQLPGPIMPDLFRKVRELVGKANVDFAELTRVAMANQALASRLLLVANSAFYARGGERMISIEASLKRLGLQQATQVFQAVAALSFVAGKNEQLREMITANLSKAYFVGLVSEHIARSGQLPEAVASPSYTVGLFNNIGGTFFVYALLLLFDHGKIKEIDRASIETTLESRSAALNALICVLKGIYVTDQILKQRVNTLQLTPEATAIGFDSALVDKVNEKLPAIQEMLAKYK